MGWSREDLVKNLEMPGFDNDVSICQTHRDLYQIVKDNPRAVDLLVDAHGFAKRMDEKLRAYKQKFGE